MSLLALGSPLALLLPMGKYMGSHEKWEAEVVWPYVQWAIGCAGPTSIKLCQWVSTRDDLLPPLWCTRLVGGG